MMVTRGLQYFRQFDRSLWVLAFGWLVGALGFSASMPFISIYFHSEFGFSMTEIGLFFGVMTIVRSVCQVIGGGVVRPGAAKLDAGAFAKLQSGVVRIDSTVDLL